MAGPTQLLHLAEPGPSAPLPAFPVGACADVYADNTHVEHAHAARAERVPTRVDRFMAPQQAAPPVGAAAPRGSAVRRTVYGPGTAARRQTSEEAFQRLTSSAAAAAAAGMIAAAGSGGHANPAVLCAAAAASVIASDWIEGHEHTPHPHGPHGPHAGNGAP